jgi:hypothetical protein
MLYLPYGLSDSCLQYKHKNNNSKNIKVTFLFLSPAHLYFYSFPPLPYLFHPTYLPSVFAHYFSPVLSLPLSHFVASAPHVLDRLTLLSAHSAPSLLLFRPIPVLSLFVSASKPRLAIIFLSFALSLLRYTGTSSVMHLSYSLLYLDSLILSLLSCLSVSLSLSLISALIHFPSALILSTSSLAYPFLLQ